MEKKYGLLTAIAMVVGIVIGSGVFYKAQDILTITNGNVTTGILAWLVGGIIMLICAMTFAVLGTKYTKINGIVDYCDATVGKKYGDVMAWFLATIYYPAMTAVLVWVTSRYTGVLFGWELNSANVMTLGMLYMLAIFAVNSLAPKLAGRIQVSTTVIKLIPLILMAVVGLIYGLFNTTVSYEVVNNEVVKTGNTSLQILIENFKNSSEFSINMFFKALVAAVFAYEGWICATSIAGELKNSKRNLPIALLLGTTIIMIVYILYYIGVTGGALTDVLMVGGSKYAFLEIFGDFFGTILNVFIVISCIGTLNGLMVASTRAFYTLGIRGVGPKPHIFKKVDTDTNMPINSAIIGALIVAVWYVYFYGANLTESWFGFFSFDSSELPIITIYILYIPLFILMIKKEGKSLGIIKGCILPILSLLASIFMIVAAIYAHGISTLAYLIVFIIIMILGLITIIPAKAQNIDL